MSNQPTTLYGGASITVPVKASLSIALEYYFDIISEQSIELINQITDNYVENNTAIQDHIAQNPLIINISGLSGEKVFKYDPTVANQLLSEAKIQATKMGNGVNFTNIQADSFWDLVGLGSYAKELNKLSIIPELYPPLSNYMQVAKNVAELVDVSITKYSNIYNSSFDNNNSNDNIFDYTASDNVFKQTRLKEIYNYLSECRVNNTVLTVTTPYGIFTDMYIQSVRLRQGNELFTTDIEMTLKQLRFSNVTTTAADKNVMAKLNAYARAHVENNGTAQGKQTDNSALYNTVTPNIEYKNK